MTTKFVKNACAGSAVEFLATDEQVHNEQLWPENSITIIKWECTVKVVIQIKVFLKVLAKNFNKLIIYNSIFNNVLLRKLVFINVKHEKH